MNPRAGVGGERQSIAAVFSELAGMAPAQRESAVQRLRAQSPSLAAEVESLLAFHGDEGSILDRSPLIDAITPVDSAPLAPQAPELSLPIVGSELGGAVLQATVGSGSRFVVYSARAHSGESVAVKVVRPELVNSAMVEGFRRAASLTWPRHAGVAHVHSVHAEIGDGLVLARLFVIEDLVDGESITDWAAANCTGSRDPALLVAAMCDAVAGGHVSGVAHGRLTPARIRVSGSAGAPMVKVTGFGLQRLFDEPADGVRVPGTGPAAMTLRPGLSRLRALSPWMAPEQRAERPEPAQPAADVYALGMIAIGILTGEAGSDPVRIRGRGAAELRQVIERATRQSATERYSSAAEMARDVRCAIDGSSRSWWSRLTR